MKVECKGLDQIRVYLFLFCLTICGDVPLLTDVLGWSWQGPGQFLYRCKYSFFQSLGYF